MEKFRQEIRQIARERGVTELYHFTVDRNVESILQTGLMSRAELFDRGMSFWATDTMRLDGCLDGLSFSVHNVYRSMFEKKAKEHDGGWVIFVVDASILWTHDCRFCWVNASSNEIKQRNGFIGGPWAFEKMFQDQPMSTNDKRSRRGVYALDYNVPTDPGAEVQVLAPIDRELILCAVVRTESDKAVLEEFMARIEFARPVVVEASLFP